MANSVPALTPLVVACAGSRPAGVLCRMDSENTKTTACSSDVLQGSPMGAEMCCLALRPGLKHFREEFE